MHAGCPARRKIPSGYPCGVRETRDGRRFFSYVYQSLNGLAMIDIPELQRFTFQNKPDSTDFLLVEIKWRFPSGL